MKYWNITKFKIEFKCGEIPIINNVFNARWNLKVLIILIVISFKEFGVRPKFNLSLYLALYKKDLFLIDMNVIYMFIDVLRICCLLYHLWYFDD